jgi:hypothetical protein
VGLRPSHAAEVANLTPGSLLACHFYGPPMILDAKNSQNIYFIVIDSFFHPFLLMVRHETFYPLVCPLYGLPVLGPGRDCLCPGRFERHGQGL